MTDENFISLKVKQTLLTYRNIGDWQYLSIPVFPWKNTAQKLHTKIIHLPCAAVVENTNHCVECSKQLPKQVETIWTLTNLRTS